MNTHTHATATVPAVYPAGRRRSSEVMGRAEACPTSGRRQGPGGGNAAGVACARVVKVMTTQDRFFEELLAHYPRLKEFWDRESREFQDEAAEDALLVLSRGEAVVLKALASIWLGCAHSAYSLDLTDLAAVSPEWRAPLVQWLSNPFWP